ncbi:MAG TPA: hypothetical protein V6C63_16565 [Allocoleopsis sp.]
MSPSASGRYQSRLFNFFSRRSREFVDQCDRALRHAKVATVWGAQVLLYPLYAIFQTTRLVGRQIQTTIETGRPAFNAAQTTSPPSSEPLSKADQVVHNVLQAVETLALPEAVAVPALAGSGSLAIAAPNEVTPASKPSFLSWFQKTTVAAPATGTVAAGETSAIAIQGVATALETRTLVLVTVQNQILDILTPDQQQQLYQRIVWEVSHYQRYLHILARQRSQAPLPLPSDDPQLLPPIRLVQRVMAWVQTGPVAIALNWFQESTVAAQLSSHAAANGTSEDLYLMSRSTLAAGILPMPPIPYEALAPIDRAIAQLEAHSLSSRLSALPATLEQRGQELANILWAAVDYFFGGRRLGLTGRADQTQVDQIPGDRVTRDRLLTGDYDWHPDPWLSYEDVFGQAGKTSGDRPATTSNALPEQTVTPSTALPPGLQVPTSTARNWWARLIGRFWQRHPQVNAGAIVSFPSSTADLATQQSQPTAIATPRHPGAKSIRTASVAKRSRSSGSPVASASDPLGAANLAMSGAELATGSGNYGNISNTWIEAEATSLGYVQHPLERVLGWLDRAMLWLEEKIIQIGQWLQQLWGK